ncbi:hypothetical protein P7L53_02420 [Thermoleptolyngbya sichuanensis XZ-Cy5]|nr:hypothetical protein [Thermoleptolyngbya sichuanensis]MDG2615089.1 hypothetical protein [Thermoleptolyngbya sichuanensis XZ-Cy5]
MKVAHSVGFVIQNHQSTIQNCQGDRPSVIEWLTGSCISHIGTRA